MNYIAKKLLIKKINEILIITVLAFIISIQDVIKINRMGGFKCMSEGIEVDVWTGDMNDFLGCNNFKFAYHPKTGIRIVKISPHKHVGE